METFRADLARDGGVFRLPDGTSHPVSIPEHVKDGENFYVSVKVTRLKPGVSMSQLPDAKGDYPAPRSTGDRLRLPLASKSSSAEAVGRRVAEVVDRRASKT